METENFLIPPHRKLTLDETKALLTKYKLEAVSKLPKIKIKDVALNTTEDLKAKDVIEITRESFAGINKYYRVVIE